MLISKELQQQNASDSCLISEIQLPLWSLSLVLPFKLTIYVNFSEKEINLVVE